MFTVFLLLPNSSKLFTEDVALYNCTIPVIMYLIIFTKKVYNNKSLINLSQMYSINRLTRNFIKI